MNIFSRLWEYTELFLAIIFLTTEGVIRFLISLVVRFVPESVLNKITHVREDISEDELDFDRCAADLISSKGYPVEEHYVTSHDGYILTMQRIPFGRNEPHHEKHELPEKRPVVFILHGFMQCSEVWVSRKKAEDCLPMLLADAGYDVWLGNVRGNKYSGKHVSISPNSEAFWDFCMDEIIQYDAPAMIEYVLANTEQKQLSYVGFSQGTAVGFGAFSLNPSLARKVNVFVALASTTKIRGLENPLIDAIARSRPELVFYMFGRRSFLSSTLNWRRMLSRTNYARVIDLGNWFLFGWHGQNISPPEKAQLYAHLYSPASVKSVVHWFQLINTHRFQMFDDSLRSNQRDPYAAVIPAYQLSRLSIPVVLFYGTADPLPDVQGLLKVLPSDNVTAIEEAGYEHLDFLWAVDVKERIFSKILNILKKYQRDAAEQSDEEDRHEALE